MNEKTNKAPYLNWVDKIINMTMDVAGEDPNTSMEVMETCCIQTLCRVLASMTDEIHMLRLAVEEKEKGNDISDK